MAYVQGELGKAIEKLMEESNKEFDEENFERSMSLLELAWDKLPDDKVRYDESYYIIWGLLDIAIKVEDKDRMKKWVDKIFIADPERTNSGEREMWAGRVAYELGDMVKAKEYIYKAYMMSRGRCVGRKDEKYLQLIK